MEKVFGVFILLGSAGLIGLVAAYIWHLIEKER